MKYVLRVLGYIWALPMTLIGFLLMLYCWPTAFWWSDGCLECVPKRIPFKPLAQTWGWLIFYCNERNRLCAPTRVHERVHTRDVFYMGVFWGLIYASHFFWLFIVVGPTRGGMAPRWYRAYSRIWLETRAEDVTAEYVAGKRPGAWGEAGSTWGYGHLARHG